MLFLVATMSTKAKDEKFVKKYVKLFFTPDKTEVTKEIALKVDLKYESVPYAVKDTARTLAQLFGSPLKLQVITEWEVSAEEEK